ncbi:MAG: phosphatidylglycerophosphatase A [Parvibaculum sp.]
MFKPLPAGLRLTDPVAFLATWFGSGLAARAPGTWGSLAALPFAYGLMLAGGTWLLLLAAIFVFVLGIWAADKYAALLGTSDPSEVVIDEVAAMWLTLIAAPMTPLGWLIAFGLFRLFDIAKPWPVSLADRTLKGGFGIMADDILAAIYAMIVLVLTRAI